MCVRILQIGLGMQHGRFPHGYSPQFLLALMTRPWSFASFSPLVARKFTGVSVLLLQRCPFMGKNYALEKTQK